MNSAHIKNTIPGNKLKHAEDEGNARDATEALHADTLPFENARNKPIQPDPEQPYQPTEPDEPDVQPEIIDDEDENGHVEENIAPSPDGFVLKDNIK